MNIHKRQISINKQSSKKDLRELIKDLYIKEFINNSEKILIQNSSLFLTNFFNYARNAVVNDYGYNVLNNTKMINSIENKIKEKDYKIMLTKCNATLKQLNNEYNNTLYIKNYIQHCKNSEQYLTHICGGKFINSIDNKYVICTKCKYAFFQFSILAFCRYCKKEYYTKVYYEEDNQLTYATWDKYHCKNVCLNAPISCKDCKKNYIIKEGKLFCIKCNKYIDHTKLEWECIVCHKLFKSGFKPYNPLEYKLLKNSIRKTLINKIVIKPKNTPCDCFNSINEINEVDFVHGKKCNGILYSGKITYQNIIVCSKCKILSTASKFVWSCPKCFQTFKTTDTILYRSDTYISHGCSCSNSNMSKFNRDKIGSISSMYSTQSFFKKDYDKNIQQYSAKTYENESSSNCHKYVSKIKKNLNESSNKDNSKRLNISKPLYHKQDLILLRKMHQSINFSMNYFSELNGENKNTLKKNEDTGATITINRRNRFLNNKLFDSTISNESREGSGIYRKKALSQKKNNIKNSLENFKLQKTNIKLSKYYILNESNKISESDENIACNNKDKNELFSDFNLSDYTIVSQIGQGAFGKIFFAKKNKELYALKQIIVKDQIDIQNMIKEYLLSKNFEHKNVLKIYGMCINKKNETYSIYILMELAETDWAKEIADRVEDKKLYTEKELINIFKQLVEGLYYLQCKSITHRDIKPQNILIFKDYVFKLCDFGEVKIVDINSPWKQINTLRGTENFMSPLMYNGIKTGQLDIKHNLFKSDVYSLGLCILFCATFNPETVATLRYIYNSDILKKYLNDALKKKYSKKFINIIISMLEINESERPDFIMLKEKLKTL